MSDKKTISELEDVVLESVVKRLDMDMGNKYLFEKAMGLLKVGAMEQSIASAWRNMSDEQAVHFQDFVVQSATIEPELSSNMVLLKFASLYPDLREKISKDLDKYFDEFVEGFNG